MIESILESTKKKLGLASDYHDFDLDIVMLINSTFSTLNQLGIGPDEGFSIDDASATWDSYLGGDKNFNSVQTYIWLKVRILFDPPSTSFVLAAMQEQVKELEWRLEVARSYKIAKPPTGGVVTPPDTVLDGGNVSGTLNSILPITIYDGGSA